MLCACRTQDKVHFDSNIKFRVWRCHVPNTTPFNRKFCPRWFCGAHHHSIAAGRCVINVLGDYISPISLCFVQGFVTVPSEKPTRVHPLCILEDIRRYNSGRIYFTKFFFVSATRSQNDVDDAPADIDTLLCSSVLLRQLEPDRFPSRLAPSTTIELDDENKTWYCYLYDFTAIIANWWFCSWIRDSGEYPSNSINQR